MNSFIQGSCLWCCIKKKKKSSPNLRSFRYSPVLSSKCSLVLCYTFRSIVHFELIFMKDEESVFRSSFLKNFIYFYSCSSTVCWKDHFSIEQTFLLCQRSVDYFCVGLFLIFSPNIITNITNAPKMCEVRKGVVWKCSHLQFCCEPKTF